MKNTRLLTLVGILLVIARPILALENDVVNADADNWVSDLSYNLTATFTDVSSYASQGLMGGQYGAGCSFVYNIGLNPISDYEVDQCPMRLTVTSDYSVDAETVVGGDGVEYWYSGQHPGNDFYDEFAAKTSTLPADPVDYFIYGEATLQSSHESLYEGGAVTHYFEVDFGQIFDYTRPCKD